MHVHIILPVMAPEWFGWDKAYVKVIPVYQTFQLVLAISMATQAWFDVVCAFLRLSLGCITCSKLHMWSFCLNPCVELLSLAAHVQGSLALLCRKSVALHVGNCLGVDYVRR